MSFENNTIHKKHKVLPRILLFFIIIINCWKNVHVFLLKYNEFRCQGQTQLAML